MKGLIIKAKDYQNSIAKIKNFSKNLFLEKSYSQRTFLHKVEYLLEAFLTHFEVLIRK